MVFDHPCDRENQTSITQSPVSRQEVNKRRPSSNAAPQVEKVTKTPHLRTYPAIKSNQMPCIAAYLCSLLPLVSASSLPTSRLGVNFRSARCVRIHTINLKVCDCFNMQHIGSCEILVFNVFCVLWRKNMVKSLCDPHCNSSLATQQHNLIQNSFLLCAGYSLTCVTFPVLQRVFVFL